MSALAATIVSKVRAAGIDLPAREYRIKRLRPGHWQRSAGAWSWMLEAEDWYPTIGSQFPATLIAKGFEVYRNLGDVHLVPPGERDVRD